MAILSSILAEELQVDSLERDMLNTHKEDLCLVLILSIADNSLCTICVHTIQSQTSLLAGIRHSKLHNKAHLPRQGLEQCSTNSHRIKTHF
jgi:hypothetical protein